MRAIRDLTGQRFGRLVALERRAIVGGSAWLCLCDCGNVAKVTLSNLATTRSCGCLARELSSQRNRRHGKSRTSRAWRIWSSMKTRCENPNDHGYKNYGARGIAVCERWRSFELFYADMGEAPPGMSLDRIDNDGPYSPENCRWASAKQQARNRRDTIRITIGSETRTLAEWCEIHGIDYYLAHRRITQDGWEAHRALTTKPRQAR